MAWTAPRTWVAGELVTAALMNTHVRDNLTAIFPIMRLRKTADQNVISSTTLVDDTHLTFSIAANEIWTIQMGLFINSGTGGFKMQMTGPAGATGQIGAFWSVTAGNVADGNAAVGAEFLNAGATFTNEFVMAQGVMVNAGTAGTCRLQWAQSSSVGTNSTIKTDSFMLAHRIA